MKGLVGKAGLALVAISAIISVVLLIQAMGQSLASEPPLVIIMTGGFVLGFGMMFVQAIIDRINNKEDDYYSKNVEK